MVISVIFSDPFPPHICSNVIVFIMKNSKTFSVLVISIAAFVVLFLSCEKESAIPAHNVDTDITSELTPYNIVLPTHFPPLSIPDDNKPFVERIELGRMLYYDPILSNDGRACATCHYQSLGFTIPGTFNNTSVLSHVNMAWYTNFMWDGSKTGGLEDIMLFETQEFFGTDLEKINNSEKYKTLFKQYYGKDYITHHDIAYALAQFTRTMISKDSKFDRYMKGAEQLSYSEEMGRRLFFSEKGDCFHCHPILITTDNMMHNTGLDSIYNKDADKGYYNVTKNPKDLGKFRTPNLRNVALRKYFMHDGRFTKLEEVIDFYDHGVKRVGNIDPVMTKAGKDDGLKLTALEKTQLVAFLNTLTDYAFISDTSFSKPTY